MNIMNRFTLVFTLLVLCQSGHAWNARYVVDAPIRWHSDTNTTGFKLQQSTFPVGSPQRAAFMDAFSNLNNNPSKIRMILNPDTEWVSVSNGVNEAWFTDNSLVLMGAPAICIAHFNPFAFGVWNMTEADVVFDTNRNYAFTTAKSLHWFYGGAFRSLRSTAAHEIGHALGLQHEDTMYNIMGEDFTHVYANGNVHVSGRGEDASNGLVTMYSVEPTKPADIGVSRWKFLRSDGEYSMHQRTELWLTGSTNPGRIYPAPGDLDAGDTVYQVSPGQRVWAGFTFENNGPADLTTNVSYVISTNSTITTRDRLIGISIGQGFNRDTPDEGRRMRLTIPRDLTPGRYYVGVIVDSADSLSESDERNNATYIPIDVI